MLSKFIFNFKIIVVHAIFKLYVYLILDKFHVSVCMRIYNLLDVLENMRHADFFTSCVRP